MMENIKRITITDFHRMETAARQAVEIAENPCNWKDGKKRKVSSVYEF